MRRIMLPAVCLTVLIAVPAQAAAWQDSKSYKAASIAAEGIDRKVAGCNQEVFDRADKNLNAAYAERMAEADGKLKEAIRKAQKLWLAARDPTYEAESLVYEGGTLENVAYSSCEARLTTERVDWLKGLDQ